MTLAPHVTYEFGPYRLEISTRRLSRGGELIPLTPKAFDILAALIERRDRVVDKTELMKLVWPDSFVEEANLSQTIFVLRKTLGEEPGGNQYIETIPRRGYRFAAAVHEATAVEDPVPRLPVPWKWVATAAAAIVVAGSLLWMAQRAAGNAGTPTATGASQQGHNPSVEAYRAMQEGHTHYVGGRFSEAVAPLTRATTLDPAYAAAWALLSKTLARMSTISLISSGAADQLHRDAIAHANRAVQLAPDLPDAHIALAVASREIDDVERWRAGARRAIELNASAEAHSLLADSYFAGNAFGCRRDRNPALAEEHYRRAIQLDPKWMTPYGNLSYQLSWLGKEDDALAMAERGIAIAPANPVLMRARAHALVRLSRADEAERVIRQILEGGASMSAQDHLILGSVALSRGNERLAAREFETTLARLPSAAFELAIARAHLDNARINEGLQFLEAAVTRDRSCAAFIESTPAFAPYRSQPAFAERLTAWRNTAH